MSSAKRGRPRKLTPEQEAELQRRYKLWRDNCPKRIAADFGLPIATMTRYMRRADREANDNSHLP